MKLKKNYLFFVFLAISLIFVFQMTIVASEQPVLIVGAIYVGSVNDAGYNQAQKEGLEEMKKTSRESNYWKLKMFLKARKPNG